MYDSIIIGAGPAGLTAAIYLARKKAQVLVIAKDLGGQASLAGNVENYPGYKSISGNNLIKEFQKQAELLNVPIIYETLKIVSKKDNLFQVKTNENEFLTKTVILASGKIHNELNIPGEKELTGRGVAYCATCDAPNFKNLPVAVIGGGNSAMDTVLELAKYTDNICLIDVNDKFVADQIMQDKVKKLWFVKILHNKKAKAIKGEQLVSVLELEDTKTQKNEKIEVRGVFVTIGWHPSTNFSIPIKTNQRGEIIIDKNCRTDIPGIFAAGDVTDIEAKQIIISAGEGAKAAISADDHIRNN